MKDVSGEEVLRTGDSPSDRTAIPPALGPGYWRVARRPKWIGVLVLVLVIAGVFAWLGRWQLERAIMVSDADTAATEVAVPLVDVAEPQAPMTAKSIWQKVTVDLSYVPGDTIVLSGRTNVGAQPGYWVVAHAVTADGASLAVATGWAATEGQATDAVAALDDARIRSLETVEGRYLPSESPQETDFEAEPRSALSVGELLNLWATPADGVYGGYLVLDAPPAGIDLEAIDSPAPLPPEQVNLLNLFYAIEWVVFAGAALFLWWRLVRDEELAEAGIDPAEVRRARRRPKPDD